jgi:signal transduction histidine kinase
VAGSGLVSLTGVGVAAAAGSQLLTVASAEELVLGGFTAVIGAVLIAAGGVLYLSSVSTMNVLRVSGWNALGVVVLAAVMVLVYAFQAAAGGEVAAPWLVGAAVVGVSAVAHVLIGVNDVRRIRARELATERERLSVVNRLVRHDLRTEAQRLIGLADRVTEAGVAEEVRDSGRQLGEMHDKIKQLQQLIGDAGHVGGQAVEVGPVVGAAADRARERSPAAEIDVESEDCAVVADGRLELVVEELVENAVEHGGNTVRIAARRRDDRVDLRVEDDGPGIPESEWGVVAGDREVTQTEHASGLGLWLVRWLVDAYGGELVLEDSDLGGSAVVARLRPA